MSHRNRRQYNRNFNRQHSGPSVHNDLYWQNTPSELPDEWRNAISTIRGYTSSAHILNATNTTQPTMKSVAQVLDTLNALAYPIPALTTQICSAVILGLCKIVEVRQDLVASKFCQLVATLSVKQQITFEDKVEELILFFVNLVRNSRSWLRVDALRSLGYVLYDSAPHCTTNVQKAVLEAIVPLAKISQSDVDVRRQSINCLGNICVKAGTRLNAYYSTIFSVLYENFQTYVSERYQRNIFTDHGLYKITTSTIRALLHVVHEAKDVHKSDTAQLVQLLSRLMFYGTPIAPASSPSMSQSSLAASPTKKPVMTGPSYTASPKKPSATGKWRESTSSANSINFDGCVSSDSDPSSDTESNAQNRETTKLRMLALQTLSCMAKGHPRSIFGQWSVLIPDQGCLAPHPKYNPSLITVLLFDPAPRCRTNAALALTALLDGAKKMVSIYFQGPQPSTAATASSSSSNSNAPSPSASTLRAHANNTPAFTPLSVTIAAMINELHIGLCHALQKETSIATLLQILKCLTVLIENSPYERLPSYRTIGSITNCMLDFVVTKERSIQTAALLCLTAIFSTRQIPIINELLLSYPNNSNNNNSSSSNNYKSTTTNESNSRSFAVETLLELMREHQQPIVRTESAQVLSAIAKNYPMCIKYYWNELLNVVQSASQNSDQVLRLAAVQIVESVMESCGNSGSSPLLDLDTEGDQPATNDSSQSAMRWELSLEMWTQLSDRILKPAFDDSFYSVRASACSSFAHIGGSLYEALSEKDKRSAIPLILGATNDEQPSVRSSACRTLGVYVLFPDLRENAMFISDVVHCLQQILERDSQQKVKIRGCWALANLTDALQQSHSLFQSQQSSQSTATWQHDVSVIEDVIRTALLAAREHEKIRSNAVRALGNIGSFLSVQQLQQTITIGQPQESKPVSIYLLEELSNAVEDNSVKVRWNSCYAIGNVLRNPSWPISTAENETDHIHRAVHNAIKVVCNAMTNDKYFKVRIQAAWALSSIQQSIIASSAYIDIWNAVLTAIDNSATNQTDFREYKYAQQLRQKLRTLLLHLMTQSSSLLETLLQTVNNSNQTPVIDKLRTVLLSRRSLLQPILKEEIEINKDLLVYNPSAATLSNEELAMLTTFQSWITSNVE